MKKYLEKEMLVSAAYVDHRCEMGPVQAALLLQDNMTELFYQYGCDAVRMSRSHGAVWALVRSKICYERIPVWMEQVRTRCFPVRVSSLAVHLDSVVETLEGEVLLRARQELCPIDVNGHTMRKLSTVPFPKDVEILPRAVTEPFQRRKVEMGEENLAFTHCVRAMDTDMNHHMNNVAYVRLAGDALPTGFWEENQLRTFDIHYANEAREGDILHVLAKQEEEEHIVFIRNGEQTLAKAYLQVEPRRN